MNKARRRTAKRRRRNRRNASALDPAVRGILMGIMTEWDSQVRDLYEHMAQLTTAFLRPRP